MTTDEHAKPKGRPATIALLIATLFWGCGFTWAKSGGENVNALLYDPGDASRLAAHLRHLVEEDAVRERLQANSPHVLATLNTFDEMVAAYATAFREAALTGPAPLAAGADRPHTGSGG